MMTLLNDAITLASSSSEGDTPWILLFLGPTGAVALYWALFRYYRNTDKSHDFEHETRIASQPITGRDDKVDEVRGTKRSAIEGNNVKKFRERVRRLE